MTTINEAARDFFYGAPYVLGSETSKAAAKAITPRLTDTQRKVYDYIMSCGTLGVTDEEVIEAMMHCGMSMNTPRARRVELVECGMVKDSGVTRTGKSGRNMVVWEGVKA